MTRFRKWLTERLVADWRSSWRWLSVQLAGLVSLVVGFIFADPEILMRLLNLLTPEARVMISPFVSLALLVVVVGVRLWKQGHPGKPK